MYGPKLPFLFMYGSHDMRHIGIPRVDGLSTGPPGFGASHYYYILIHVKNISKTISTKVIKKNIFNAQKILPTPFCFNTSLTISFSLITASITSNPSSVSTVWKIWPHYY